MPDTSFIESAAAYCKKLTTRSKSNFYYAFLFLPRERREALEAVYAYCRLVDDVVDEDAPVEKKLEGIARWRLEFDVVFWPNAVYAPGHRAAARRGRALCDPPRGHGSDHRRLRDGHRKDALRVVGRAAA